MDNDDEEFDDNDDLGNIDDLYYPTPDPEEDYENEDES